MTEGQLLSLAQQVVSGLSAGSIYALLALALVLIYQSTDVVNFAQGEMAMFTTFIAYTLLTWYGVPFLPAVALTLVFAFLLGYLVERVVVRPVEEAPVLSVVIVTLGLYSIFNSVAGWVWGYVPKGFPSPISGGTVWFLGLTVGLLDLWIFRMRTGYHGVAPPISAADHPWDGHAGRRPQPDRRPTGGDPGGPDA